MTTISPLLKLNVLKTVDLDYSNSKYLNDSPKELAEQRMLIIK